VRVTIPDFSLVVLIGASGSGKSTFAREHFLETEVVSSDRCRALVADDESDQSATKNAFDVLYTIVSKRLETRRLTVVDATNLRPEDRAKGIEVARKYHAVPVAVVFDVPADISIERNKGRADRNFGAKVVHDHMRLLRKSMRNLRREGYRSVYTLDGAANAGETSIVREPLYTDLRGESGPFDIIGDVHGCIDELELLLHELGYRRADVDGSAVFRHPEGRRAVFLGDLVDRGPGVVETLRLVMGMVKARTALCVPGNHENKLLRALDGRNVTISHGLAETLAQLDGVPESHRASLRSEIRTFIDGLISHYWLDGGKLVVAHAGLRESMHGRGSREVREFARYGETTGETDEFGLPIRYDWASEYRGDAIVAYGHTPVPRAEWINKTSCLDTGCVYGGALTALRYPELELASVPAARTYVEPIRPVATVAPLGATAQQRADDVLDIEDVAGKRRIVTRYGAPVAVPTEHAAAALEIMSRFCADPRWLIYLPPTMSPPETSRRETLLEHPDEAFGYFRKAAVTHVVMEEKHMGSRAVVVLGRDDQAIRSRFGIEDSRGTILTRTGRAFFGAREHELGTALLHRLGAALDGDGFWDRFSTGWVCLDAEVMPWSVKAQGLIDEQYAPVGEASIADLSRTERALRDAVDRGVDASDVLVRTRERLEAAHGYALAYRRYVRPVRSVDDLRIAPFHILATEGAVHVDRDHAWHMTEIARACGRDPEVLVTTPFRVVDLADETAVSSAVEWWEALTEAGGEGAVVKPLDFVARDARSLKQPAIKVRGREYLRVVYGPEYTLPQNIDRLRDRAVHAKRRLAISEFSLGLEALHRFVERAPLRSVHECVFGVLALESEPIDPRL